MSNVLKSERKPSKTDFLDDINTVFIESCKRIERIPKKLMVIRTKMYELVFDAQTLIYEGNSIFPTTGDEVRLRRAKLVEARAKLYAFKRTITVLAEITDIRKASLAFWTGLVQKSIESLSKIITANGKQYKKILDEEKKRLALIEKGFVLISCVRLMLGSGRLTTTTLTTP